MKCCGQVVTELDLEAGSCRFKSWLEQQPITAPSLVSWWMLDYCTLPNIFVWQVWANVWCWTIAHYLISLSDKFGQISDGCWIIVHYLTFLSDKCGQTSDGCWTIAHYLTSLSDKCGQMSDGCWTLAQCLTFLPDKCEWWVLDSSVNNGCWTQVWMMGAGL